MSAREPAAVAARLGCAQRLVLGVAVRARAVDESAVRAGTGWESWPVAVTLAELTGMRLLWRSGAWWEPTPLGVAVVAALPGVGGRAESGGTDSESGVVGMTGGGVGGVMGVDVAPSV